MHQNFKPINKEPFNSSTETFNWLSRFINLERGQKPKSFRIDRMEILCTLAGNPQKCAPSIHVAGSKGKGSVTSMLAAMLTAAGYRVARYMSPHVIDIRERICLGDDFFSEEVYCFAGDELRNIVEEKLPSAGNPLFDTATPDGCEPTFWELLTLLFFLCARQANCGVMVVETGMGGRLDSTNVLDPLVSVITLIELEHTNFLGTTIQAIAKEKAGIIKQGKPLVLAKQCKEALEVFKQTTKEKQSPLFYLPNIADISDIKINPDSTTFTFLLRTFAPLCEIFLNIPGKVQAENAALAITAIKTAFPKFSEGAIRQGLANLKIPARFEKISSPKSSSKDADTPPFIIDGAHTPESLSLCVETFCSLYGKGGVLLFGCAADKDTAAMARIACPHFAKIFITTPGTFKSSNPSSVYEAFSAVIGKEKITLVVDTEKAVKLAIDFARQHGCLPILGTGSFYLVSEIRKIVHAKHDFN